jgi:hypothetical protein
MQEKNLYLAPEFISGFVSGEGCFYVESGFDKKYKLKHRIRPAFSIEVSADDRELIELIQKQLNCGNIYDLDFGRYKGYESKGWKPHVKYRVSNIKDISEKIVPFFKQYPPHGKKNKSFEVFCEIVEGIIKREHISEETLPYLKEKAKLLNSLNKRGL